ncbi:MAG: hypothetical protein JWL71_3927 [Acidobacteria bacterium]|jgi:hypothetical protein|nr:hypothetical protein [Acidobacteriota bacterium]
MRRGTDETLMGSSADSNERRAETAVMSLWRNRSVPKMNLR